MMCSFVAVPSGHTGASDAGDLARQQEGLSRLSQVDFKRQKILKE